MVKHTAKVKKIEFKHFKNDSFYELTIMLGEQICGSFFHLHSPLFLGQQFFSKVI